jgi:D-amino-acid oxidase
MEPTADVLVVGAGVSGLTTAVCLAEAGMTVRVRARELPLATTSCAAGAIWGPYLLTDRREQRWSDETRHKLEALSRVRGSGVRQVLGREVSRADVSTPEWATKLPDFRTCTADELPTGYSQGWWYSAPIVDMPTYLGYLRDRLREASGTLSAGVVRSLDEAAAEASIVVNCTGIGARQLVTDVSLTPVRGQLVVVENPGIERFFAEYDDSPTPTYYLPHRESLVLGGSAEAGRTDLEPDLQTSVDIQRRCAVIEPALERAKVLEHRVGLRPTRPRIRLEHVNLARTHVIHNYGHGGAGVTVSWGCAREVLRLINEI